MTIEGKTSRRAFSAQALALGAGLSAGGLRLASGVESTQQPRSWQSRLVAAPRLFCIAYVTPDAPGQGGQEARVARYPLAIVPQDRRTAQLRWRDKVRSLNPNIVMLGYQMTIEETTVPGPGHDVLRRVQDCWTVQPNGQALSVAIGSLDKKRRVYDPRKSEWQEGFVAACRATLRSDPFEGLFLDQCTVYDNAHPDKAVRDEMRRGIQDALTELRRSEPHALIVANSAFSFTGVNGELNEGRPRDYAAELAPHPGLAAPRVDLAHVMVESDADRRALKSRMRSAHDYGAYFGAARDYQHVEWYDEFELFARVPRPPSKPFIEDK